MKLFQRLRHARIREYFPKGTVFTKILQVRINSVTKLINEKPLRVLNWHPPADKFNLARWEKKSNN